jgi:hypothetical protein
VKWRSVDVVVWLGGEVKWRSVEVIGVGIGRRVCCTSVVVAATMVGTECSAVEGVGTL